MSWNLILPLWNVAYKKSFPSNCCRYRELTEHGSQNVQHPRETWKHHIEKMRKRTVQKHLSYMPMVLQYLTIISSLTDFLIWCRSNAYEWSYEQLWKSLIQNCKTEKHFLETRNRMSQKCVFAVCQVRNDTEEFSHFRKTVRAKSPAPSKTLKHWVVIVIYPVKRRKVRKMLCENKSLES